MGACDSDRNYYHDTQVKFDQFGENNFDPTQFYDVIVSINSIKDINKGWKIKFSDRFEKNYKDIVNSKVLKIGIIGNSNKGKSFILSKLSRINLPSGTSIRTEGLSIKYPDLGIYKNRRITLLDSAGLETPVISGEGENIISDNVSSDITVNDVSERFKEKSREKIITESFLQNYIIHNSDILIIVVGILTYSEQKILNRINMILNRGDLSNKPNNTICIIHNLMTYTTVPQVQTYINETLLNSATFKLEEKEQVNFNKKENTGVCYFEKNNNAKIFHLIFANDYSEAGAYYNNFTLNFMEHLFEVNTDLQGFNIIESVKERFKVVSKDIFENLQGDIEFENCIESIKLKHPKDLTLKKLFIDELGFSFMCANKFEPKYNFYKTENQIIIKIEAPGNCSIQSSVQLNAEYIVIKIKGEKERDMSVGTIEDNVLNRREFGKFSLDIPFKQTDFYLKNEKPKIYKEDGIFILIYQIEDIKLGGIYPLQHK